jgi:lysophospholipase L1-like esterase
MRLLTSNDENLDIAALMIGTNDICAASGLDTMTPVEEFRTRLTDIVNALNSRYIE